MDADEECETNDHQSHDVFSVVLRSLPQSRDIAKSV
jgi:hypothetical protein